MPTLLGLLPPASFAEACGGHDSNEVAHELKKLGFLKTNEGDRLMSKHGVLINGEKKRMRLYAVLDSILEHDITEASDTAGTAGTNGARG